MVVCGLGEEVVALEESGSLEFVHSLVNHFFLVDDAQGEEAEGADEEEKDAEEEEEAEDIDVAFAAVRVPLIEEAAADLALPHATEAKGRDGDCERDTLCVSPAKVLCARGDGGEVHAAGAHANQGECGNHDAKRPAMSPSRRRRATLVCKCGQGVSQAKEQSRKSGGSTGPQTVTEISKEGHQQVQAKLCANGDDVDLDLGVVQLRLEQVAVERVGGDAAGAEAVDYRPDKAQPADEGALHLDAVALVDALGNLFEEAAGVTRVVALARAGVAVGSEQRVARRAWWRCVLELVDGVGVVVVVVVVVGEAAVAAMAAVPLR